MLYLNPKELAGASLLPCGTCEAGWSDMPPGADWAAEAPWLTQGWRALEAGAALPTQTLAYAQALARTMVAPEPVRLVWARRNGALAAVLPLVRARTPAARWRLLGISEVHEPGDVLASDPAAVAALAGQLARLGGAVWLGRLPAGSALVAALSRAMHGRGHVVVRPAVPCPTLALGPQWADPASQFNAGRRSDLRRARRRAEALGPVALATHRPTPAALPPLLDAAIGVEDSGWKLAAGSALAVDAVKQAFFREFLGAAAGEGWLTIHFLHIGEALAAMQLALEWQRRLWLFKIGYNEAFAKCSPGSLLMLHAIADAAARGLDAFELMGQAEGWIARDWTPAVHGCVSVRGYPASVAGAVALARDGLAWGRQRLSR